MQSHVIGHWTTHEQAVRAAEQLELIWPQQVSLSTSTPHEHWWQHSTWLTRALETVGGAAAAVSQLVPGFGVLFMGGPLDGVRQGDIIGRWLQSHGDVDLDGESHFVIVAVTSDDDRVIREKMTALGGLGIHTDQP